MKLERYVLWGTVLLFLVLVGMVWGWGFYARDLRGSILPAARGVWRGEWRYWEKDTYNPPWVLLPVMVISWLPDSVVQGMWFVVSLIAIGWCCWKAGLGVIDTLLFMVSPPVVYCLAQGQVDWMPMVGMYLPGAWGVLGLLVKPQMGAGIAAVKSKGVWKVLLVGAMGLLVLVPVPLLLIGKPWSLGMRPRGLALVVAAVLLYCALRYESVELASIVSLLATPYFTLGSLSLVLLLYGRKSRVVLILVNIVGWLVLIIPLLGHVVYR